MTLLVHTRILHDGHIPIYALIAWGHYYSHSTCLTPSFP